MIWNRRNDGKGRPPRAEDRRDAQRHELMSPYICSVVFAGGDPIIGLVRNIGIGGMLIEFQTELGLDDVQEGSPCSITDMMPAQFHDFADVPGKVEWVYKKFVGVAFTRSIFADGGVLLDWLKRLRISHREVPSEDS